MDLALRSSTIAVRHFGGGLRLGALLIVLAGFVVFAALLRPAANQLRLMWIKNRLGRRTSDETRTKLLATQKRVRAAAGVSAFSVFVGKDGRMSSSKTVALAWTFLVGYVLAVLILSWPPSWDAALKNLSPTYLLLLAGPYASLVLAKGVVSYRTNSGTLLKTDSDGTVRLSDLVSDDAGNVDVFDVQFLLFNAIALWFVVDAFNRATSDGFPSLPSGLVLLTGGPAAVYLSNKTFGDSSGLTLKSVTPGRLLSGDSFVILGSGFLDGQTDKVGEITGTLTVNGYAVETGSWTDTRISATAPAMSTGDGTALSLTVVTPGGESSTLSNAITIDQRPQIMGFDRDSASAGQQVVMMVDWPASTPAGSLSTVDCGGILLQGPVVGPGSHTIAFTVPGSTAPGELPLRVHGNGRASDVRDLKIVAAG